MTNPLKIDLKKFECAISNRIRHLIDDPVKLECDHYLCSSCKESADDEIICRICGKMSINDYSENEFQNENEVLDIDLHINDLVKVIEKELSSVLIDLKKNMNETKERVELQFEFVREEVEIKVESLKANLDNLLNKFTEELTENKNKYFRKIDEFNQNIETGEDTLKRLKHQIDKYKDNQKPDNFFEYHETLTKLTQLNDNLLSFDKKIEFTPAEGIFDFSIIGRVNFKDPFLIKLRNGVSQIVKLNISPSDLCVIPENRLLTLDLLSNQFYLFDENFELLKKIEKIDGKDLSAVSVTCNFKDRVYLSDTRHHQIWSTNFDFNLISRVGSKGSGPDQFNMPCGMCFHENALYVCDSSNNRIQKLTEDLLFQEFFMLNFEPMDIKIVNTVACIHARVIYFYQLPTFNELFKYDGHDGYICTIGSHFYEFSDETETLYCYNSDGTLNNETQIILPRDYDPYEPHHLAYFNNKLIICDFDELILI